MGLPNELMATQDAEVLAQMLRSLTDIVDAKLGKLENQRESDARQSAENHGENKTLLNAQNQAIILLQRQMSSLIGEGQIDGRIGTMQREIQHARAEFQTEIQNVRADFKTDTKDIRDDLSSVKRWLLATIAGFLTTVGGILLTYLLSKRG